jgi:geranylgeranyl pyrophosphate synthase
MADDGERMEQGHMPGALDTGRLRGAIDDRLGELARGFGAASSGLGQAMAEAALAPGKRFRGMLMLLVGEATGGVSETLIDAACAVELAHTASLVFDDLPCMDGAAMRRGRATTHVAHGEGRAILAGIALVTEALRLLAAARGSDAPTRARLVATLAAALGPEGLSAGQDLDLNGAKDREALTREQDLKTGALFAASFEMLGMVQRLDPAESRSLAAVGRLLGRAFQSYDDLLDVVAEAGALGKDVGRDAAAPGRRRGLLAVHSLADAAGEYDALRADLEAVLARRPFETAPLSAYIAQVLPQAAPRAA